MAWYPRHKLDAISTKITDSCKQMEVYTSEQHVVSQQYFTWLRENIETTAIPEQLRILEPILYKKWNLCLPWKKRDMLRRVSSTKEKRKALWKRQESNTEKKDMECRSNPLLSYENETSIWLFTTIECEWRRSWNITPVEGNSIYAYRRGHCHWVDNVIYTYCVHVKYMYEETEFHFSYKSIR